MPTLRKKIGDLLNGNGIGALRDNDWWNNFFKIGRLKLLQKNYPLPKKINRIPNFEISFIDVSFIDNSKVHFKKKKRYSKGQSLDIIRLFHSYFSDKYNSRTKGNKTADSIFNHLIMCEKMIKKNIGNVNYQFLFRFERSLKAAQKLTDDELLEELSKYYDMSDYSQKETKMEA